jgi:hypothetical protein
MSAWVEGKHSRAAQARVSKLTRGGKGQGSARGREVSAATMETSSLAMNGF